MKKIFLPLILLSALTVSSNIFAQAGNNEEITLIESKEGLTLTIKNTVNGKEVVTEYKGDEAKKKVGELGKQGYLKSRETSDNGVVKIKIYKNPDATK